MHPTDRSALLYRKIGSIMESDRVRLDQLDESLGAAVRSGADIPSNVRALALEATARIVKGEQLTAEQKALLESIVLGNGLRPAFDIERDSFGDLPSSWSDVNQVRPEFEPVIRSVGRLNVSGHPGISYAGTAFVCGPNILLTNRHVVEEFMKAGSSETTLEFKPGMTSTVDLKQEVGSSESTILEPIGEAIISTEWDAAVLRVSALPPDVTPVPMSGTKPVELRDRTAAVIGYPAFDESENLIEQITIFRGIFNKKRLQPGKFLRTEPVMSYGRSVAALLHDCSTLGGNSGAAVFDVPSRTVLGLHFGGTSGVANYCVPSWELERTPAFAAVRRDMSFV